MLVVQSVLVIVANVVGKFRKSASKNSRCFARLTRTCFPAPAHREAADLGCAGCADERRIAARHDIANANYSREIIAFRKHAEGVLDGGLV